MNWKTVRLELSPNASSTKGSSPSRAFLIRVPLDDLGVIDAAELARDPTRATVLRTWSSEPDQFGHIERADGHWLFRCPRKRGEDVYRMSAVPLGLHDQVTVEDPSGATYPFTIASIGGTNRPSARA